MKLQLRYFASIREALGRDAESVETSATTVADLQAQLQARGGPYAQVFAPGRPVRAAVQQVMARADTALVDGAEVGFFPPVTGG
jgi:molybdopterin synthase sulfur carrier subunit